MPSRHPYTPRRYNRGKRNSRRWLLAVIGLALLAGAGWGGWFVFSTVSEPLAAAEKVLEGDAGSGQAVGFNEPTAPDALSQAVLARYPLITLTPSPVESGTERILRHTLYYVRGGHLSTIRDRSRQPVIDLVKRVGGVAGLNGTFFGDPKVAGTGNKMVGPILTTFGMPYEPIDPEHAPRCEGRPLVLIGDNHIAIVAYEHWMGDSKEALQRLMPDVRDAFLGGGWIVHQGMAQTEDEIRARCVKDAQDFRRRAFIAVDSTGRVVFGATDFSIDSARLAVGLKNLDLREAVLLDCGFSTSLVYRDKILVTGHQRKDHASRPVPHALILTEKPVRPEESTE